LAEGIRKARPRRGTTADEFVSYLVRLVGWEYHYGFRGIDPKSRFEVGTYSEIALLTFTGVLVRPNGSKYSGVTVTLSGRLAMLDEEPGDKRRSIGSLSVQGDDLDAYIFVPAERMAELAAIAQSGRFQFVQFTGTKLRYRAARIYNVSLYTHLAEDEW